MSGERGGYGSIAWEPATEANRVEKAKPDFARTAKHCGRVAGGPARLAKEMDRAKSAQSRSGRAAAPPVAAGARRILTWDAHCLNSERYIARLE
ncbi:MAG: hypothetical protein WD871_01945 [Xanthobacteraceae bacterium]